MKFKVYQRLIPASLRERIYQANVQQYEQSERERLRLLREPDSGAELSSAYIRHLRVLANRHDFLNAMPKEAIVAQIGVGKRDLITEVVLAAKPRKLHLLDRWTEDQLSELEILRRKFVKEISLEQIAVHNDDPLEVLNGFENAYFDWVYLATDTSYESVSTMLELCRQKVKKGGIIGGGNYARGSVPDRAYYGVVEAVHAFCKRNGWEMVYLTHESCRELSFATRQIEPSKHLESTKP